MVRTLLVAFVAFVALSASPPVRAGPPRPPNIVLILADDLGCADLGCTGSRVIGTPSIDRLRREGMLFTQAHSPACVCAPSRCSILTGKAIPHAQIRDNAEFGKMPDGEFGGQAALAAGTETIARALQRRGYATMVAGKWGLGGPGEPQGHPLEQGFDRFFGYLCQYDAHHHYPAALWDGRERIPLPGNGRTATGATYAPDLFLSQALEFIDANRERPFFLFFATTVPHLALQAPEAEIERFRAKFAAAGVADPPYEGQRGYLPCPSPRATYAAMVSRFDRDVGRLVARIDELGLGSDTLIVLTSDNGGTFDVGGFDPAFFRSNGALRGAKCSLWQGGVRVPLIARRTGAVPANAACDLPVVGYDLFPTFLALAGAASDARVDGIDLGPALRGSPPTNRPAIAWEDPVGKGTQAVRDGNAVRRKVRVPDETTVELFDLAVDPGEGTDVAAANPEVVARLVAIMDARTPSSRAAWNFDAAPAAAK
jgi:arylsulfatase